MGQTLSEIRQLLDSHRLRPRHRFGQNFLIDAAKLRQIVEAAEVRPGDIVLEVGPGTGVLTEAMLDAGARVIAVEIDRDLAALLRSRLGPDSDRFVLLNTDALADKNHLAPAIGEALLRFASPADADAHRDVPFKLVANLPYNIASPLLAILAADWPAMRLAVVMVQLEVAQRLTASPGGKDFGPLTVILQAMCETKIITRLPPGCFWPPPQVDSAVVKITRRPDPLTRDPHRLSEMLQTLFSKRRKQIGTILGRATPLPPGIDPAQRPEQLRVEQIIALAESLPRT